MTHEIVPLSTLRRAILDDLFKDFETSRRWVRKILQPLAWPSAHRFAGIAARFDSTVDKAGFRAAMRELLQDLLGDVGHNGIHHVPTQGPLLVISNHPGTYDSVAIAASLPRDDLHIVAQGFPLLRNLPHANRHFIFMDPQASANVSVVRSAVRHLDSGGSLLIFPSGRVEPDPAVLPGALSSLESWSPSVELFLRKVPQTKVLITIVSGVLNPVFLRNPLIRFWRGLRDPQMVAEVIQVITQLLFSNRVNLSPRITFSLPSSVDELIQESENLYKALITKASQLLDDHIQDLNLVNLKIINS